ncbi:MAG TPA: hypothetical protein VIV11_19370 [Kofleriaceae bacterium]
MSLTTSALGIVFALIPSLGCEIAEPDDPAVAQAEQEIIIPQGFFDRRDLCWPSPGAWQLQWRVGWFRGVYGGYCGPISPIGICSLRWDADCMANNPRLRWLLDRVCYWGCRTAVVQQYDPPAPPPWVPPVPYAARMDLDGDGDDTDEDDGAGDGSDGSD